MSDTSLTDLVVEARRLSELLDRGLHALRQSAQEWAEAEHEYRQAKAQGWLAAKGTVNERESMVEMRAGDLRRRRDLAEGMRMSALEAVRSRRAQLSALQSILAAHRAEAEYDRTSN
jgi:hypothetical protein